MAHSADSSPGKNRQAFEDEQLKPVAALELADPEIVDFAVAENIGLITADTRTKIEQAMPNHDLLFQRALTKERNKNEKTAFRRAFEIVYGKFLMEQGDESLEKPGSKLMKTLSGALKFPIGPTGLKGRSELLAAIRKLRMLGVSQGLAKTLNEEKAKLEPEIATKESGGVNLSQSANAFGTFDALKEKIGKMNFADTALAVECFNEMSGIIDAMQNLNDSQIAGIEAAFKGLDTRRNWVTNGNYQPIMVRELFTQLSSWRKKIEDKNREQQQEVEQLKQQLDAVNKKLSAIGGSLDPNDILSEAFATETSSVERKRLERELSEAEKRHKELKEAQGFFAGGEGFKTVSSHHNRLTTLLSQAGASGSGSFQEEKFKLQGEVQALERMRTNTPTGKRLDTMLEARLRAANDQIEAEVATRWAAFTRQHASGTDDQKRSIKMTVAEEFRRKIEQEIAGENRDEEMKTGRQIAEKKRQLNLLEKAEQESKGLYEALKALIDKLALASKEKIVFKITGGTDLDIEALKKSLKAVNLDSNTFDPKQLLDIFDEVNKFFGDGKNKDKLLVAFDKRLVVTEKLETDAKEELEAARADAEKVKNLTDSAAAKKIIAVLVARQFPDASMEEKQKLAALILANDVTTLQTDTAYGDLAKRGSSELLDVASVEGFKGKLLDFRYKEGDKTVQPFKGLEAKEFSDWHHIEHLFAIGKLNHQTGFFVLAALEIFDGENRSIQSIKLEEKLKALLAKQLGVEERMDEAGIVKIVNDAFNDQKKKTGPLMHAYFEHFELHEHEWEENLIEALNLKYEKLAEEMKLGKIEEAVYEKRMRELVKEAQEEGVLEKVDFAQDQAVADFWNSPHSEWLRNLGYDAKKYATNKAKAIGAGSLRVAGRTMAGTAMLAGSLAVNTALLPVRLVKYPFMLVTKPLVLLVNLFRSNPWNPFSIRESVGTDVGRFTGYFKGKATEVWTGAQKTLNAVPEEWNKAKPERKEYKNRSHVDTAALDKQIHELEEKAHPTAIETAGSPFIDMEKYKKKVEELDKILAGKTARKIEDKAA